jgi:uncharacterized damage-inducible protein DinB
MKELLKQYAAYNSWANQRILASIFLLAEEKHRMEVTSSFNSIYATVLHMWDAESAWWQRVKLQERVVAPSESFTGSMPELGNNLLQQNQQWIDWVNNASDAAISHVFQYYNSKKEYFKQPVFEVLMHVFNHSNYHRGQLVNMLRQLGVEKIPATDYIVWSRKK